MSVVPEDSVEPICQFLERLAREMRAGDVRPLEYSARAESREVPDSQWVLREPTGVMSFSLSFQRKTDRQG